MNELDPALEGRCGDCDQLVDSYVALGDQLSDDHPREAADSYDHGRMWFLVSDLHRDGDER